MIFFTIFTIDMLAIAGIFATVYAAFGACQMNKNIEIKVRSFIFLVSCLWGAISFFYFCATWLNYPLDNCYDTLDCAAVDAVKQMINVRWQSFYISLTFLLIAMVSTISTERIKRFSLSAIRPRHFNAAMGFMFSCFALYMVYRHIYVGAIFASFAAFVAYMYYVAGKKGVIED